jgi:catechol 2,3-dioxygenase-like lactoylglutathione lyase family enzyme
MTVTELFAGVPVRDLDAAFAWYERLAGRPFDFRPNDDEAVWRFAGGWIYVVRDAPRAGHALLTLLVDDLDAEVDAIAARGLEPAHRENTPVRKARFEDPDGNWVTLGQP